MGKNFAISGNLSGLLAPGRTLPLQLSLTNPNKKSISVTNLSVTLQGVTRTRVAISHSHNQPCTLGDYAVIQYSGPYPLVVPSSPTMSLSALGVPSGQWPPDPAHQQARPECREQPGWLQGRHPVAVVFRIGTGQLT